ncbi:hypothetical protein HSE3_gp005 [Bacillus phage vB_BceM-HSE3]|nr:hypothetical protein HSE3_gp005 [Bacillus phage vB_BceM-HSE3]
MKKKLVTVLSVVGLSAGLLGLGGTSSAEESGFSLGKQYENGGYDTLSQQPVSESWSFNSRYEGAKSSELHAKYTPLKKANVYENLIDSDGTVYTVESNQTVAGTVVSYDKNGVKQWSYTPPNGVMNLVLSKDGKLYFRSAGKLHAISKTDGTPVWSLELPNNNPSNTFTSTTIDKDGVIYTNQLNILYAINPDGTIKWERDFGKNILSQVKIDKEGRIFLETSARIYALNKDGTDIWSKPISTNDKAGNLEFSNDSQLILTYIDYNVPVAAVVNRADGTMTKKVPLEATPRSVTVSDLDGSLYLADNTLKVYDKDFNLKWNVSKKVNKVLLDNKNNAFFSVENDGVYAVDSAGLDKWSYKPQLTSHKWTSELTMDNTGKVYAGLTEKDGTASRYSLVVLGSDITKSCDRMSVQLESDLNRDIPDYQFHATPFYDFDVCGGTVTFQFENSDASILAQKDTHISETKERLNNTGPFANNVRFIWKDVRSNTILHEQSQQ